MSITQPDSDPQYVADQMRLLAYDRAEKYRTHLVPKFFPVTALKEMTYLGSFTWSLPKSGIRYMLESKAVNLWGVPQSPAEIARDYITIKYPKKLRCRAAQKVEFKRYRVPPLYAKRGYFYDMCYVDLQAAYWTVLQAVGWDCDYHPGLYLVQRSNMHDFPCPDEKLARNCLVSAGLTMPLSIWTGDHLIERIIGNPHPNVGIWTLCQDVLHAASCIALEHGAVYVHTDGYIVPREHSEILISVLRAQGLCARVKYAGDAVIYGPGTYDIGDNKTKRRFARMSVDTDQIRREDYAMLLEEFAIHAKNRGLV